jgi:hypothetical protein
LTHYLSDEVKAFPHLILLNPYFGMSGHRIEVLLHLKWDLLGQAFHSCRCSTVLEAKIFIFDNPQELSIAFLKEELALFFQD